MKIYKLYESIINEAQIESCVAKFGYELFGSELGGKEPNTGIENNYVRHIEDFTDNKYGEATDPYFIKAMKTLKSCTDQYPEILIPNKTIVYRGEMVPLDFFINNKIQINMSTPMPYIYKSKSLIQSWSTNFNSASVFGNNEVINEISDGLDFKEYNTVEGRKILLNNLYSKDVNIPFVFSCNSNNKEFIFKAEYFKFLSSVPHEDELIRIGRTPIKVMAKYNDHSDIYLTRNGLILMKYINQAIKEL